jgi:hypothetical protein
VSLHEQSAGASSEWRTPQYVFTKLGCEFDLDVASPGAEHVPWIPANHHLTRNSLTLSWGDAFCWMNAPFGGRMGLVPWLMRFFTHPGGGIALVPDRTSCPWFQEFVPRSDLVLFIAPKIKFLDADGTPGRSPAQGTVLCARSERACEALKRAAKAALGVLMRPVAP